MVEQSYRQCSLSAGLLDQWPHSTGKIREMSVKFCVGT